MTVIVVCLFLVAAGAIVWLFRDERAARDERRARTRDANERDRARTERLERRRRLGLPDDDQEPRG